MVVVRYTSCQTEVGSRFSNSKYRSSVVRFDDAGMHTVEGRPKPGKVVSNTFMLLIVSGGVVLPGVQSGSGLCACLVVDCAEQVDGDIVFMNGIVLILLIFLLHVFQPCHVVLFCF